MTQTRTLIAAIAFLIAGLIIGAGIASTATEITAPASTATVVEQAQPEPAAVRAAQVPVPQTSALGTDFGLVHLALGDADWTQDQVTEVLLAADRVCEGLTAGVPMAEMASTLTEQQGLALDAAVAFTDMVSATRC